MKFSVVSDFHLPVSIIMCLSWSASVAASPAIWLAQVSVTAAESEQLAYLDEEPAPLEDIEVRGEPRGRYGADEAATGLRTEADVLEIPASVQVVTEALIEDQAAFTIDQALRNVSGVTFINGGEGAQLFSRGFSTQLLRDGFLRTEFTDGDVNASDLNTVNIERIEVLKGPASVLYGRGNAGGLVNLVTKKPLAEPYGSVGVSIGSFSQFRFTGDVSQPLVPDRDVGIRVVGSYENSDSFRNEVDSEISLFAPSIAWQPSPGTNLILAAEYANVEQTPDDGVLREGDQILPGLTIESFLNEPEDLQEDERAQVFLSGEHELGDVWTVRARAVYSDTTNETLSTLVEGLLEDQRTVERFAVQSNFAFEDARLQTEAIARTSVWGMDNELLFGFDYANRKTDVLFSAGPAATIDAFDPVYGQQGFQGDPFFSFVEESERDVIGGFVQNRLSLTDRLSLIGGVRVDYLDQDIVSGLIGETEPAPEKSDTGVSPRVGVVYEFLEDFAVYGQWARSFTPPNGAQSDVEGNVLDPETGQLFEAGIKTEVDGIVATLAGFHIRRDEVVTPDIDNPGFLLAAGEQESQGVEFDVSGEPLPGWNLSVAYAFIDGEIVDDAEFPARNRLQDIPRHSFNFWSTYEIQGGPLRGLRVGGGVQYVGERAADPENSFFLPSFTRVDAVVAYPIENRVLFQLNIQNLTDEELLLNASGPNTIGVGAPRAYIGSVTVDF